MRISLEAKPRESVTKGQVRKMRREGWLPVTVSTKGEPTKEYTIAAHDFTEILRKHGPTALIELKWEKESSLIIAKDIQRDPVQHKVIHIGFQQISAKDPVTADVPVVFHGQPLDVKNNTGVLSHELNTIQVRALPDKLPEHITVNVESLQMGQPIHVSDLPASDDYEIMAAPDTLVAAVHPLRKAVSEEEAEAPAEAEVTPAAEG
jgi:large subunit ribosomal protein L25